MNEKNRIIRRYMKAYAAASGVAGAFVFVSEMKGAGWRPAWAGMPLYLTMLFAIAYQLVGDLGHTKGKAVGYRISVGQVAFEEFEEIGLGRVRKFGIGQGAARNGRSTLPLRSSTNPIRRSRRSEARVNRLRREEPLPEQMQGRWIGADDPLSELVVDGGEITCFGTVVNYDHKVIVEKDGALAVSLGVDDDSNPDDFQRANITGLVVTPEGQFHVYNLRFGLQFVRPSP